MKKRLICMVVALSLVFTGVACSKKLENSYKLNSTNGDYTDNDSTSGTKDSATGDDKTYSEIEYDTASNECDVQWEDDSYYNPSTEEYNSYPENEFMAVSKESLSTFSADVDTASYSNMRRMINESGYVDSDAIRVEELLNYFKYDYNEPEKKEPFGVNVQISKSPWNQDTLLMMIGMQTEAIDFDEGPDSNLVFLLDVSGSMDEPNKLPLMQQAFSMLAENLTDKDRVSIVTYAGEEAVILEGAKGSDTNLIIDNITNLEAGGSTAGSAGIQTAYELAERYFLKGGNNRVILATDGDLNVGLTTEYELTELITQKRESGIFLSVLGFGTGNIKDNKMEALADNGNGNYSYIDSVFEAKKVLVDELGANMVTVAKDVKFQVEFNPEWIKGYRLIGYENRILEAEDFADDTKDAGEVGAGHSVTVLYEVVPVSSEMEMEEKTTGSRYQVSSTKEEYKNELLNIQVRYKEPKEEKSKLLSYPVTWEAYTNKPSEDWKFASCIAEFAMVLKESPFLEEGSIKHLLKRLDKLEYVDGYREEFKQLVTTVAKWDN